ncbi:MAG: proprotein convertase P-domain-containing protein [Sandaracinaceae bacterium]|nr:proprotein convertase P-domain-containing protein [Sandaracinaceae bacterium]
MRWCKLRQKPASLRWLGIAVVWGALGCAREKAPPDEALEYTLITFHAESTPEGAKVIWRGRELGKTPLSTELPIPRFTSTPPFFSFAFELDGYERENITASPLSGVISLSVHLRKAQGEGIEDMARGDGGASPGDGPESQQRDEVEQEGYYVEVHGRGCRIRDLREQEVRVKVKRECVITKMGVMLMGRHAFFPDLVITLVDPGGKTYELHRHSRANPFRHHVIDGAKGAKAIGVWKLIVSDENEGDDGVLDGWRLELWCRAP